MDFGAPVLSLDLSVCVHVRLLYLSVSIVEGVSLSLALRSIYSFSNPLVQVLIRAGAAENYFASRVRINCVVAIC